MRKSDSARVPTFKAWHLVAAVLVGAACSDLVTTATDALVDTAYDTAVPPAQAADSGCNRYEVRVFETGFRYEDLDVVATLPRGWVPFANDDSLVWLRRCAN